MGSLGIFGSSFYDIKNAEKRRQQDIDLLKRYGGDSLDADALVSDVWRYRFNNQKVVSAGSLIQYSDFLDKYNKNNGGLNPSEYFVKNRKQFEDMDFALQHYIQTCEDGKPTLGGFMESLHETSVASKMASAGFRLLSVAANAALSLLISFAINAVIKGIDNLIHAQEKAQEAFEESTTKFKEYNKEISDTKKYINDTKSRYAELAQGVDNVGNNVSLTAEEYRQYNEITNKIAELFPQMIQGYTDEGNAIIAHKGNVEELTKAYNDYVDAKQNAIIIDSKKTLEDFDVMMNGNRFDPGKKQKLDATSFIVNSGFDITGVPTTQIKGLNSVLKELGLETVKDLTGHKSEILAYYKTLKAEIESEASKMSPIIDAYLGQNEDYKDLPQETKNAIKNVTNTFKSEFYSQFDGDNSKLFAWIDTNLLEAFKNQDFSSEFSATLDMQTKFNSNEISYDEYIEKLNALKNLLKALFPNDENLSKSIDILFNIQGADGTDMSVLKNKATTKVDRRLAGKVGSLTKEQLEMLSSSDIPSLKGLGWDDVVRYVNGKIAKKAQVADENFSMDDEAKQKYQEYKDAVNDLAQKEKEFAKNLRDHDKNDHLERLKADLSEHKAILDAYEAQLKVLEWGSNLTGEQDYSGKIDIMTNKLALLNQQGAATRAEFERVMSIAPATGDEAVEISNRLSELGEQLRSNVTSLRETTVELEKLKIAAIDDTGSDYFDKMNYALDSLDKKINRLKNGKSTEFSSMVPDVIFPTLLDFADPIAKKKAENKELLELETTQQKKLNKIISDAVKKQNADNATARAEERQKLIEDMEKTRREMNQKIQKYADEIKAKTGKDVDQINQILSGIGQVKISSPDTTDFDAGLEKMKEDAQKTAEEVARLLGQSDGRRSVAGGNVGNNSGFGAPLLKMESVPVTGQFGEKRSNHTHKGNDYAVPIGTSVYATKDGKVTIAETQEGYGNVIYIDHGDGYVTRYGHLSTMLVKAGQTVTKGQQIALSGNTGLSTGPHLHYEVRYNGNAINPNSVYASGTPLGNAKSKNVGIAGENYKSEILVDKATGKMTHINKPTPIDLSKTDVIGEARTAEIFNNRAFAEGTDYSNILKSLFDGTKTYDEVFKELMEPFNLAVQKVATWANQQINEIYSDSTLSDLEKQNRLTEIQRAIVYGNDQFQGYGTLGVQKKALANEFYQQWQAYVNANGIAIDSDTLKQLQDLITDASDVVDKADEYVDNIAENTKYALTKPFDDWFEDSENWISQMQSLDIFNEGKKSDQLIAARSRQATKIRDQLIAISQADLPQETKDALWKETYAKYTPILEDMYKLEKQRYISHLETLISKEESLRDVRETQFNVINKLAEAEKTARTALRTSLIGSQYLDPETRKLVYNEDDYKAEITKIKSIRSNIFQLSKDYSAQLSKLGDDDIEQKEQIINEYKRKVDIQERELEIAQREVDLQKKKDQLNNVLAERNVRQIVNGKWEWVADTDKVREATEAFADAEYNLQNAKEQAQQQLELATYNARIGAISLEKSAAEQGIAEFQAEILKLCDVINYTNEPITEFGNMLKAVVDGSFIEDMVGKHTSIEYDSKGNRILSYDSDFDYKHFMDFFDVGSDEWQKLNEKRNMKILKDKRSEKMLNEYGQITKIDGVTDSLTETAKKEATAKSEMLNKEKNATDGATEALENFTEGTIAAGKSIAETVYGKTSDSSSKKGGALSRALANDLASLNKWANSSEGKSTLSGLKSVQSNLASKTWVDKAKSTTKKTRGYASGTDNAKRGWAELVEKGDEVMITNDGIFRNMSGGEVVFSNPETHNLKDLAQINTGGLFGDFMQKVNIPTTSRTETVDKSVTLNGDIVIQNPADFNEFTRKLTQAFKKPRN